MARPSAGTGWPPSQPGPLRLAFLDPPYPLTEDAQTRQQIQALAVSLLPLLEAGGVTVVRTPESIQLPELEGYDGPGVAVYGTMRLHFYQAPLPGEG